MYLQVIGFQNQSNTLIKLFMYVPGKLKKCRHKKSTPTPKFPPPSRLCLGIIMLCDRMKDN